MNDIAGSSRPEETQDEMHTRIRRSGAFGSAQIRSSFSSVIAAGCIFAVALFGFWYVLINHNLSRVEAIYQTKTWEEMDPYILGADAMEYTSRFANYATAFSEIHKTPLRKSNFFTEFRKRPLFGPISATMNILLHRCGFQFPQTMLIILSIYATTCSLLIVVVLKKIGLNWPLALPLAFTCIFSFAWLSLFSIPESYSLTVCGLVACLISGEWFYRVNSERIVSASLWHGVVVGVSTWLYLPLVGGALLVLSRVNTAKHLATLLMPVICLVLAIALAPQLVEGGSIALEQQSRYGWKMASFSNVTLANLRDVSIAFLFFSFVSPVENFLAATGRFDLAELPAMGWMLFPITCLCIGYWRACAYFVTGVGFRRLIAPLAWLASLILFFTFYNPNESLLYLSVPVILAVYSFGIVTAAHIKHNTARYWAIVGLLSFFSLYLFLHNIRPIAGGDILFFAQ